MKWNLFKKTNNSEPLKVIDNYPLPCSPNDFNTGFSFLAKKEEQKQKQQPYQYTLGELELIKAQNGEKNSSYAKNRKLDVAVANQWINPHTGLNTGASTIQKSLFINKPVNFWECAATANDPIFVRLFRLLTEQILNEGYKLYKKGSDKEETKIKKEIESSFDIEEIARKAIELSFSVGGCLAYMDTEDNDTERLKKPMSEAEYRAVKRFVVVSPLMLGASAVNSRDPTRADYMRPSMWYVSGKGNIHASRFVRFSHNEPVNTLLPLSLYFGIPYTQSLVQDVANIHSISQNLAQLVARFRERYIKTNRRNLNTTEARENFQARLKSMVMYNNNFTLTPISDDEEIVQLISPINGLENFIQSEALVLCLETGLSMTKLLGVQSKGFGNKNEGDQNNFIETIIGMQKQFEKSLSDLFNAAAKALGYEDIVLKLNKPEKIMLDNRVEQSNKEVKEKDEKDS